MAARSELLFWFGEKASTSDKFHKATSPSSVFHALPPGYPWKITVDFLLKALR